MLNKDEQEEVGSGAAEKKEVVRELHKNISGKMQQVKPSFCNNREINLQGHVLARYLYHQDPSRCPEIIRHLNEDLELAEVTLRIHARYFKFRFMSLIEALGSFLKVLWTEDEPQIQHQLITHFSYRYLQCTRQPLNLQADLYYMSWAIIKLNADLNGNHKGRKRTCEEFIADLKRVNCFSQCNLEEWKDVYESIKRKPLKMFRVITRCEAADKKETEKATKQREVASRATEDGEVASGVTEDGEVASGVTEEREVASRATEDGEVASGVTEEKVASGVTEEGEVASGVTEEGEVASGVTEEGEVASGVTEDGEVASGVTEEGEVASGVTEEKVASGVTEDGEVASGVTEEGEVASGLTEEGEVASGVTEEREVASRATEDEDQMQEVNLFQQWGEKTEEAEILGRHLFYRKKFRCPENIQLMSEDLKFADATVKAYVSHFRPLPCLDKDFRWFLSVFWPEDEPELQHLLVKHFTRLFLTCTELSLEFQPVMYYLCWNMIILNADLNGGHNGRKMTREEFIAHLSSATNFRLSLKIMRGIYESIKTQPLTFFTVRTRCQSAKPKDSSSNSSFGTENNPTTTVYKKGNLICKRVKDENGRKTKIGQRAWKPFTAVLKGMVLHLQQDTDKKNAIRLDHALAYPIDYKKRPHVLCLRTADTRLFYFQAESEVEQASWVAIINRIAARYSAPPLTSASHDINAYCPQLLPSYPTVRTLEQQLEFHKDQLKRVSVEEVQEMQRYLIYVKALQELVAEKASATQHKG